MKMLSNILLKGLFYWAKTWKMWKHNIHIMSNILFLTSTRSSTAFGVPSFTKRLGLHKVGFCPVGEPDRQCWIIFKDWAQSSGKSLQMLTYTHHALQPGIAGIQLQRFWQMHQFVKHKLSKSQDSVFVVYCQASPTCTLPAKKKISGDRLDFVQRFSAILAEEQNVFNHISKHR